MPVDAEGFIEIRSSHQMSQLWSCGVPGCPRKTCTLSLPSNGYSQRRPSTESYSEHEELVTPAQVYHLAVRRSSSTMVNWRLWCISLLGLTVHALLRGMGTLRRGVPLPWPRWWTPVGVSNHGKTYCMYLDHVRPFGAVRIVPRFRFVFFFCGTVRRSGERIIGFWCGFVPCSFHCVASCSPFGFGACPLVGNTVTGQVNQRVGRSRVVRCMCVLNDSAWEF